MNELLKTIKENKEKYDNTDGEVLSVKVFSNITLNLIDPYLINSYLKKGIKIKIEEFVYGSMAEDSKETDPKTICIIHTDSLNLTGEPLDNPSNKDDEFIDLIFEKIKAELRITLDNLKKSKEIYLTTLSYQTYEYANGKNNSIFKIIQSFNSYLYELENSYLNLKILNIDSLLFRSGGSSVLNFRELYKSVAPYKLHFLKTLSDEIAEYSCLKNGKVKKVLALDCDNTLWYGTIAEDGQEGIKQDIDTPEGKIFKRIQEDANFLASNGAIVCLASKNFEEDVLDFFKSKKTHLSLENISAYKVNWSNKAGNLKDIATELNLGIDSFIFVDDTDHEVKLVTTEAPEVEVIQVPVDINLYPKEFSNIRNKFTIQNSKTNKASQYKQIFERNKEMSESEDFEKFLETLNIKLVLYKNKPETIKRVSDLSQKTNQFNMTTKRYTENQIQEIMNKDFVYCFRCSDRFGDSGITGFSILKISDNTAVIDTFLLSCRILGRNIETEFLTQLLITLKNLNVTKVLATYIETPKNKKFGSFYENFGFKKTTNNNLEIDLKEFKLKSLDYIEVINE